MDLAVRGQMALSGETVAELLWCAERERADSTDYCQFTSLINSAYDAARKTELIELMWRIACADDAMHRHEEQLIRKIAELFSQWLRRVGLAARAGTLGQHADGPCQTTSARYAAAVPSRTARIVRA